MLLKTYIDSVKNSYLKEKYTLNKNIKKEYKYSNVKDKKYLIDIHHLNIIA